MLSPASRRLTYSLALLYALLGAALFFWPGAMAPVFAWKVTPFMTMTIGGWSLGNAWLAWIVARRWDWRLVYTTLGYLWLFGALELAVVMAFADKLQLQHPIAWLYMAALGVNVLAALGGVADRIRLRLAVPALGTPVRPFQRAAVIAFVVFVGFLALFGMSASAGAIGTNGGIFPEVMSLFTLRSFAAFYLALAVGAAPLLVERNLPALLHHAFASYGLIIAITASALVNLRLFDFAERPGGLLYIGAYLVVGGPLLFVFYRLGTGLRPS